MALAARGKTVHLSTTDPTAHLASTLEGSVPGLQVDRIDPAAEMQRYSWPAADATSTTRAVRLAGESAQLARVTGGLAKRTYVVPWVQKPPVGIAALRDLTEAGESADVAA